MFRNIFASLARFFLLSSLRYGDALTFIWLTSFRVCHSSSNKFLFPSAKKIWLREERTLVNPKGYEIELAALMRSAFDPET